MALIKNNRSVFYLISAIFFSCSQNQSIRVDIEPILPPVGIVKLNRVDVVLPEHLLLDIAINVFDVQIDEQEALEFGEWIFSEIRNNETHYLPYVLRNTLLESNQWGAVRVLPTNDPSVDLQIQGTVLASNGKRILLRIVAQDSAGRVWLDQEYADIAFEKDFPTNTRFTQGNPFNSANFVEPFQDIYNEINNALVEYRASLTEQNLLDIKLISRIVYGSDLAPESFQHNLMKDENNLFTLVSLPAEEDPMLERVNDMRIRHHLFIDTVDQYYASLYEEMQPSYAVWRKYSFDQINEELDANGTPYNYEDYGRSGRYLTLTQRYDRYRWSKIFEMEYQDISAGFNNEIGPAILELNENVHGLSGTMAEQYIQWRRILRQLFTLEVQIPN